MGKWERADGFGIGAANNKASQNLSIKRGLRYERGVHQKLSKWTQESDLGLDYIPAPWLRNVDTRRMCQPDGVLLDNFTSSAIVMEAKLNWKDGRDEKLLKLYLDAVRSAFGVATTWPLLVTKNVRGYKGEPLLGLKQFDRCLEWQPGALTPVMLLP